MLKTEKTIYKTNCGQVVLELAYNLLVLAYNLYCFNL